MFNVMIVDDLQIMRKDIIRKKVWGEKTGFLVKAEASNGEEALEKIKENNIDLIITDIKMPKVDGLELLKKIKDKNSSVCVILLSEYSEFKYAREGIIFGAFDYLTKPINEKQLEEALLRAKKFLVNQRKKEEKINKLDKLVKEDDIIELIEYIKTNNELALNKVEDIINSAVEKNFENLQSDKYIVKKVADEIIYKILLEYKWYNKFVNISNWKKSSNFRCDDISLIKKHIKEIIKKLMDDIAIFKFTNLKNRRVEEICNIIIENIENNISLELICKNMNMNKSYISHFFRKATGKTIVEHMTFIKMERAKNLLLNEDIKVYEVSYKLSYNDVEYFSRTFKKYVGISPKEFKNLQKMSN
ncbi:response regulator transcription factor [Clostridium septicum]|uniref:Stage 0 sporulation protein A homolog n=1 Tax=Clostridium septicum TaxID=1504 RepID=A0A9N7JJX3_CLOSE|nr:response regulator [Clostridium septicum]AYE33604.1 DNA-binding response regulator [Clostridium septicum]MDU1312852.1 response regulator [Clostridium septicum]QAS61768.1 response regulator [Clostridium septicum]UEC21785.1 response regulator [Clostridium septicum]USS00163.1 response regulator [Clostridium septicum]